jgi:hypothetical protein
VTPVRLVCGSVDSIQEPGISAARFAKAAGVWLRSLTGFAGGRRDTVGQHQDSDRPRDRLGDMATAALALQVVARRGRLFTHRSVGKAPTVRRLAKERKLNHGDTETLRKW